MRKNHLITLLFSLSLPILLLAQETIHGRISDVTSNEPLSGAVVISERDTTLSDDKGRFSVRVVKLPAEISVQFVGYQALKTTIREGENRIELVPSTLALNEVIVTSGLQENSIRNITGSVDLVTKGMLQRDDPFMVTNAINRVPGVYMHSGTYNTNRITIRGIGSRSLYGTDKIKAYFDQIPLTDGSGNSSLEDIDQALIDRIEIVKGPNSSLYGAGMAGVVKLYGYQPESNQTSLESNLTLGSYGTIRWMNRFSQSDEAKSLSVVYSRMSSDGYRENSEYDRDQIGITSRFYLDDNSYISFLGFFTHLKAHIPSSINADDFQNNPATAASNWAAAKGYEQYDKSLFGISYISEITSSWELSTSIFYKYRDAYEPTPIGNQGILDENTVSLGTRNTISWKSNRVAVSAGFELFQDNYEWSYYKNLFNDTTNGSVLGPVFSINEEDRWYSNMFAEAAFTPAKKLSLIAGLNLNFTNYHFTDKYVADSVDQSGNYSFEPILSPRIGASYRIDPLTSAFLNVSHGFSPPGLNETLYPDGQINPNIQPEHGWNFESGLKGNRNRFNYDLSIYLMRIQNLIVAERVGENQYIGVNAGLNTHFGLDLYTSYYLPLTTDYTLNFFNSLSWMHYEFTDFINEGNDYSGNQLTGVPVLTVNPGIELISEMGFYGNMNGQYVGKIPINDANSLYSDAYFVLRTKVGYRLLLNHWEFDLNAGVNNLTNEHYASMLLINATGFGGSQPRYYYPAMPRNYFGGLSMKYTFN